MTKSLDFYIACELNIFNVILLVFSNDFVNLTEDSLKGILEQTGATTNPSNESKNKNIFFSTGKLKFLTPFIEKSTKVCQRTTKSVHACRQISDV